MIRVARIISVLMHPLLMPTYGLALMFYYNRYLAYSFSPLIIKVLFVLVFATTFLFPSIISYFLLKKKIIKSLDMESKEERTLPFLITGLFYALTYYLINKVMLPPVFGLLILTATAGIIAALVINLVYKISIHMIGIGGITGGLLGLSGKILQNLEPAVIVCLLIAGILGTCRLILKSHTPTQVYSGFLTGFVIGLIMILS